MKTQFFSSVEEWIASNPTEKVVTQVLATINKGVADEMRKEIRNSKQHLSKMAKAVANLESLGLPVSDELTTSLKTHEATIAEMEGLLPKKATRQPKKVAKKK